jgi:lactate dehydrogenase-like 2-hydroxyacid dehydrogenase
MTSRIVLSRRRLPGSAPAILGGLADTGGLALPDHDGRPSAGELAGLSRGADAILCLGNDVVDAGLLDAAGARLQVVALASTGFDKVDLVAAAERGVVVTHTPGVLAETTADLAFALVLAARRRLLAAADDLRSGAWATFRMDGHLGLDVHGATLGLVGFGRIGRAVARRAAGFGMRTLVHDPGAGPLPDGIGDVRSAGLDVLLRAADVVSLHVPLTPATRGMLGERELASMKPTATLVNTSRGGVVDEPALFAALRAGRLHSAALDVFEREPLPAADVATVGAVPNLLALPHVGSATEDTRAAMVDLAARNIAQVLTGAPPETPVPGSLAT